MSKIAAFILATLIFGTLNIHAEDIPKPRNPNCNSPETCQAKATVLFEKLKSHSEQLLKAQTDRDIGVVCYRLNQVSNDYFELKNVDFNYLSHQKIDGKGLYDLLFLTGNINVPGREFCGVQLDKNGTRKNAGNLENIKPLFNMLNRDTTMALQLLTPGSKTDREKSKAVKD